MVDGIATLITDLILALFCLFIQSKFDNQLSDPNWRRSYILVALAAITGGTYHVFHQFVDLWLSSAWWLLTLMFVGMACLKFQLGVDQLTDYPLREFAYMSFFGYIIWLLIDFTFLPAAIYYLVVFTSFYIVRLPNWIQGQQEDMRDMLVLLVLAIILGNIWFSQVQISSEIGHADLGHILQAILMYQLYKIIKKHHFND